MIPKILVVDDEKDVELLFRQRFRSELKTQKILLHFAFSGEDALRYLQSQTANDVLMVLSDINMPGMNGLQLAEEVKSKFPQLKLIMVSAYGDDNNRHEAEKKGVDDFVTKPVEFDVLKSRMNRLLNLE
ncbi:MAG: response regulator [Bacteroidetes bacterium]|nr:response regulator [Bacteroidota bacterium]